MTADKTRWLDRGDARIAYRRAGTGAPLVMLHATLSSSHQLRALAADLSARFDVVMVDRRGSGASVELASANALSAPIDVATHIDDLDALFEAESLPPALLVGHSYGGCLALELAARRPRLVRAVWAYEPPYATVAPAGIGGALAETARLTQAAAAEGGPAAAAEVFMAAVSGAAAFEALPSSGKERIRAAGRSAIADAALLGLEPEGLARISCPVVIANGTMSSPIYEAIARELQARISDATLRSMEGLDHMAPIKRPEAVADAITSMRLP